MCDHRQWTLLPPNIMYTIHMAIKIALKDKSACMDLLYVLFFFFFCKYTNVLVQYSHPLTLPCRAATLSSLAHWSVTNMASKMSLILLSYIVFMFDVHLNFDYKKIVKAHVLCVSDMLLFNTD